MRVTNLYEPGSTFKPIIASAALAAGKWKLDTVYNDKGAFAANGHIIRNWNGEGYGPVRLLDILKYSINTGMAEIGTLTGADISRNMYVIMALVLKQVLNCLVKEQVFCIIQRI